MALPSNYTELAFIANNSNAWIDTGFVPTLDTRVVVDFMPTDLSDSNSYVFGEWVSWQYGFFGSFLKGGGNYSGISFHYSDSHHSTDVTAVINTRYIIDANKETWTLKDGDGTTLHSYTFTRGEARTHKNLYLFTFNGAGNRMLGNIYSCKIYDNGTLVRDFVPCKNPDGVVGLYDNVGAKFYGSSASSDTFDAGDEVESEVTLVSTSVTYASGTAGIRPADSSFTATNKASVPVTAANVLWTRTVKTWSDGTQTSEYASEPVTVASTSTVYSTSHSDSVPADSTFTAATIADTNPQEGDKVWSKTTTTYSTGYATSTHASTTYTHGEVTSTTTYSTTATASEGTRPADSTFTATSKASVVVSDGQWLWSRTAKTYADGTSAGTTYAHEVVTVSSTATAYSTSHTAAQPADSTFTAATEAATSPADGDTVWQRTTITYSTGYVGKTYSSYAYVTNFLAQAFVTITDLNDGQSGAPMGRNILRHAADLVTDEDKTVFSNSGDDGGEYQGCAVSHADRRNETTMMEPLYWRDIDTRIETGKWYTVQITCKGSGQAAIVLADNSSATVEYSLDGGAFTTGGYFAPVFTLTDTWTRHYVTFRYTSGTAAALRIRCYQGAELYATQPKLEEGEEPTAFCVNEADLVGPQGDKGTSVVKISDKVEYAISNSGTTPPTSGWVTDSVPTTTVDKPFLWTRCTTKYENASDLVSYSVSRKGDDGTSVTITKTETLYYVQSKGSDDYGKEPATNKYAEGFPDTLKTGDYLWSLTRVTYSDNNKTETVSASRIGDDGAAGVGIHIAYATNSEGGDFRTEYFEGATYIGTYQDNGTYSPDSLDYKAYKWSKLVADDAVFYEVVCTNLAPNVTYSKVRVSFIPYKIVGSTRTRLANLDGEDDYLAIEDKNGLNWYTGAYTVDIDAGDTARIEANLIIGHNAVASATCNPVVNGDKGDKGGDSTIESTLTEYAVTNSGAQEPTTWSTTRPTVEKGQWLWSRTTVTYKSGDGTTKQTVTLAVSYAGEDGKNGESIEIKKKAYEETQAIGSAVDGEDALPSDDDGKQHFVYDSNSSTKKTVTLYYWDTDVWYDGGGEYAIGDFIFDSVSKVMWHVTNDSGIPASEFTAVPHVYTPTASEGFLINGHLWFYLTDTKAWEDAGQIQGPKGDKGDAGRGISSADVMFCVSTSQTSAPADSEFKNTTATGLITSANAEKYLWQCTKTEYTSGSPTYTGKMCLGQVKGFTSVVEEYAVYTSGTNLPSSGISWKETIPDMSKGLYLWTRSRLQYGSNVWFTTPVCVGYWGTDGQGVDGEDACNLELNPSPLVWTQNDTGVYDDSGQPINGNSKVVWDSQTIRCTFYKGGTAVDISSSDYVLSYAIGTGTELSVSAGGTKGEFVLSNPTGSWTQGSVRFTLKWNGKTFSRDLTIGLNRVGEWHYTVKKDVMTSTSTKVMQEVDERGYVKATELDSEFRQTAAGADFTAMKNGAEVVGMTLNGENSSVAFKADKFSVVNTDNEAIMGLDKSGNFSVNGIITAQALYRSFSMWETSSVQNNPNIVYPEYLTDVLCVLSPCTDPTGNVTRRLILPYPGDCYTDGRGRMIEVYGDTSGDSSRYATTALCSFTESGSVEVSQYTQSGGKVAFNSTGESPTFMLANGQGFDHCGLEMKLRNDAQGGTAKVKLLAYNRDGYYYWLILEMVNCSFIG